MISREKDSKGRKPQEEGPPPCGYCYNCNTRVDDGIRWCDDFCKDQFAKEREKRRQEGRSW